MDTLKKLIESDLYHEGASLRLHLGCGTHYIPDYINIDFPKEEHPVMKVHPDAEADILDLNFPYESVDEIRSHHLFEHFSRVVALAQLVKWHYWLKIDGVLTIETPDLMGSVEQLVSEDIKYKQKMAIVRHLAGDQSASWGFHKDLWWDERYETTLSMLGFHITNIEHTQWNRWPYLSGIRIDATKVSNRSVHDQTDQCSELLKESMVSDRETATFRVWEEQLFELLENLDGGD